VFWLPARSASEGDVVAGDFVLLKKDATGDLDLTRDLLPLYHAGVREFNLTLASGGFWSGRNIEIEAGSGITITAVPEPGSMALSLLGLGVLAGRRRP